MPTASLPPKAEASAIERPAPVRACFSEAAPIAPRGERGSALAHGRRTNEMQLAILGIGENQLERAVKDIWSGLNAWRLWTLFGYNDVKMRYRRSTLGPFWASLSMGAQVLVTGFVMAFLFHITLAALPALYLHWTDYLGLSHHYHFRGRHRLHQFGGIDPAGQKAVVRLSAASRLAKYHCRCAHDRRLLRRRVFVWSFPGPDISAGHSRSRSVPAQLRMDGRRRRHPVDAVPRYSADRNQCIHGAVLADAGGL